MERFHFNIECKVRNKAGDPSLLFGHYWRLSTDLNFQEVNLRESVISADKINYCYYR